MQSSDLADLVPEQTQIGVAFGRLRESVRQLSGMLNSVRQTISKG
jgi:hypothetical protein